MDSKAFRMLKGAMDYYGHAPFGLKGYSPNLLTFNSLSHVHVTIFYDKAPTDGLAQKIESQLENVLVEKLSVLDSK